MKSKVALFPLWNFSQEKKMKTKTEENLKLFNYQAILIIIVEVIFFVKRKRQQKVFFCKRRHATTISFCSNRTRELLQKFDDNRTIYGKILLLWTTFNHHLLEHSVKVRSIGHTPTQSEVREWKHLSREL